MSLVTRGLGDIVLVVRGYGAGVGTTLPAIQPGHIDARPLLYPPTVSPNYGVGVPPIDVPVTVYQPTILVGGVTVTTPAIAPTTTVHGPTLKTYSYLQVPHLASTVATFTPTLYATYSVAMPTIYVNPTALEPYVYFTQFVDMPHIINGITTYVPNIAVGDLLDYIYMTLGIATDTEIPVGIVQSALMALGVKDTHTESVVIEQDESFEVDGDTIIEFNVGIAQTANQVLGMRQDVEYDLGVREEFSAFITQTLDY